MTLRYKKTCRNNLTLSSGTLMFRLKETTITIFPGDHFSRGPFFRWPFFREPIFRGPFFPRAIFRGPFFGDHFSRGPFFRGPFFREPFFPGKIFPGFVCYKWLFLRGNLHLSIFYITYQIKKKLAYQFDKLLICNPVTIYQSSFTKVPIIIKENLPRKKGGRRIQKQKSKEKGVEYPIQQRER